MHSNALPYPYKVNRPTLSQVLSAVDIAEQLHGSCSIAAVGTARGIADKADALVAAGRAEPDEKPLHDAVDSYLKSKTSAAKVVAAANTIDDANEHRKRHHGSGLGMTGALGQAISKINAQGLAKLAAVPEDAWIGWLKPEVDALIAQANEIADRIGIDNPRPPERGVRDLNHPWGPTMHQLEVDTEMRHNWENLELVLNKLNAAHSFADALRGLGLVPLAEKRTTPLEHRWRAADKVAGDPRRVPEHWMRNRHVGQPGVWTSAELDAYDAEQDAA
ncbi:hypothetical protein [Solicola gregarius]|uniref:Uncharacterized protein n=1 Tax=Solicola gregarius TaxID=2908642 RepID=A0AA46YIW8_9ACTN|nr:hypothetical protein [Solicola gregarius]UYM03447.1 hypothetical protein L0C25_12860 [Solicola gregarius]